MSDYDVLNMGLTPAMAKPSSEKTLLINNGPAYLVYATKDHCANAIKKFLLEDLTEDGKVRFEFDILNAEQKFGTLLEHVNHVHSRGNRSRSVRMQDIFNDKTEDLSE